jgi:hypothetical protein
MVNSTVQQWSRLHLSLPTKFYSSALNDRPHSCIHHSHIALRSAVTNSTPPGASNELKTLLFASYRRELSSNIQKWVTQNKKFWTFYGNFVHKNSRFCSILSQMYAITGTQVFLVDQFKLMLVKWSSPLRFHDSTVYLLVTFLCILYVLSTSYSLI